MIFIIVAIVIMAHQWICWGNLFDIDQILHHETFFVVLIAIAITLLAVVLIMPNKQKKRGKK